MHYQSSSTKNVYKSVAATNEFSGDEAAGTQFLHQTNFIRKYNYHIIYTSYCAQIITKPSNKTAAKRKISFFSVFTMLVLHVSFPFLLFLYFPKSIIHFRVFFLSFALWKDTVVTPCIAFFVVGLKCRRQKYMLGNTPQIRLLVHNSLVGNVPQ